MGYDLTLNFVLSPRFPRPVTVEPMDQLDDEEGLPEKLVIKNQQFHKYAVLIDFPIRCFLLKEAYKGICKRGRSFFAAHVHWQPLSWSSQGMQYLAGVILDKVSNLGTLPIGNESSHPDLHSLAPLSMSMPCAGRHSLRWRSSSRTKWTATSRRLVRSWRWRWRLHAMSTRSC